MGNGGDHMGKLAAHRPQHNIDDVDNNVDQTPSKPEWFGASSKQRLRSSMAEHLVRPDMVIQVDTNPVRHTTACELTTNHDKNDTDRNISLRTRLGYALQVAKGILAVHSAGVVHLDIKTDNVLLTTQEVDGVQDCQCCVTDFGCAERVDCESTKHPIASNTGTLAFMAPELITELAPTITCNAFKCDAYSFGFLLYECVTFEREPLCRRQDPSVTDIKLQSGEMDGSWGKVPQKVFELTSSCMSLHSNLRPQFGGDGGIVDKLKETLQEP